VARSDGRLLHMFLRSGEPHKWVLCGPHATEEKSVGPLSGVVSS
jgi:hypothetical protein